MANKTILNDKARSTTSEALQVCLTDLVDLALQIKQAHWNLKGPRFRSIHLQLDEIVETVRGAVDDVAERIVTIGVASDGRAAMVAEKSRLPGFPEGFVPDTEAVSLMTARLAVTVEGLRESIEKVEEADPISEDLLVGISGEIEKHLWMMRQQEV